MIAIRKEIKNGYDKLALKIEQVRLVIEKLECEKEKLKDIVSADGIEEWLNRVYILDRELDSAIMDVLDIE